MGLENWARSSRDYRIRCESISRICSAGNAKGRLPRPDFPGGVLGVVKSPERTVARLKVPGLGGWSRSQRTRAGIGGAPSTTGSERRPGAVFFCYWFLDSAPNHAPCFLLNLPDTVPRRIRPASRKDPANGPTGQRSPEQGSAPSPGPPAWSDGTSAAPPLSPPPRTVLESSPNRPRTVPEGSGQLKSSVRSHW